MMLGYTFLQMSEASRAISSASAGDADIRRIEIVLICIGDLR
jgi:hypothetical protein